MEGPCGLAMLATLAGFLALLSGLLLLLLPVLIQELSRPRDSAWGAVVLLLGLVLVTSSERLTGAPMLAVLCAGLLIGRLGGEVAQARWRALSQEERLQLGSLDRWQRSLNQLAASLASLLQAALALASTAQAWLAQRRQGQGRSHGKRWVRRDDSSGSAPQPAGEPAMTEPATTRPEVAEAAAPVSAVPLPAVPLPAVQPPLIAAPDGLAGPSAPDDSAAAPSPAGASGTAAALPGPAPGMPSPLNATAGPEAAAQPADVEAAREPTGIEAAGEPGGVDPADMADMAGPGARGEALAEPGPAAGRSTHAGPALAAVSAAGGAGSAEARPAGTAPIHISDFSEVDALLDQAAE
jgi:hypothetical protein